MMHAASATEATGADNAGLSTDTRGIAGLFESVLIEILDLVRRDDAIEIDLSSIEDQSHPARALSSSTL